MSLSGKIGGHAAPEVDYVSVTKFVCQGREIVKGDGDVKSTTVQVASSHSAHYCFSEVAAVGGTRDGLVPVSAGHYSIGDGVWLVRPDCIADLVAVLICGGQEAAAATEQGVRSKTAGVVGGGSASRESVRPTVRVSKGTASGVNCLDGTPPRLKVLAQAARSWIVGHLREYWFGLGRDAGVAPGPQSRQQWSPETSFAVHFRGGSSQTDSGECDLGFW